MPSIKGRRSRFSGGSWRIIGALLGLYLAVPGSTAAVDTTAPCSSFGTGKVVEWDAFTGKIFSDSSGGITAMAEQGGVAGGRRIMWRQIQ